MNNFSPGTSPPSDVTAVQDGPTSIRVSWTPSSDATGYWIYYTSVSDSGDVGFSGGSTDTYTLTYLENGENYNITVVATSNQLSSVGVALSISLGK